MGRCCAGRHHGHRLHALEVELRSLVREGEAWLLNHLRLRKPAAAGALLFQVLSFGKVLPLRRIVILSTGFPVVPVNGSGPRVLDPDHSSGLLDLDLSLVFVEDAQELVALLLGDFFVASAHLGLSISKHSIEIASSLSYQPSLW